MPETIVIILLTIIIPGFVVLFLFKQKKLSVTEFQKYSAMIKKTSSLDPAHSILESHKIFVKALKTIYPGKTAAKVVANAQKNFPNKGKIWSFHGLRNRIAHETGVQVSEKQAESARKEFVRALKSISK